jgi:protein-S-isoprenylcysteine O-methyltransferase Ste14
MSVAVALLRAFSLLLVASPMLIARRGIRGSGHAPRRTAGGRLAVLANFGAFIVFFPTLFIFARSTQGLAAVGLGLAGSVIAAIGSAIVWRSRSELGPAWSLLPKAGDQARPVTTGPYRVVRHPIYLGLSVSTIGLAVAFGNVPALLVVVSCVGPTFLWRALVEERLLMGVFGAQYDSYREKTKMIVPYVL